jgi:ParB family transcriptional regulator, chromosome partitioning protein
MAEPEIVRMIPVDAIAVLNPRVRKKRVFNELVSSIGHLGLKKPITVSHRGGMQGYDLVCGQGPRSIQGARTSAYSCRGHRGI